MRALNVNWCIFLLTSFFCLHNQTLLAQSYRSGSVKGFRASVVKVNITPSTPKQLLGYGPRMSNGVHDSLYHRIVAIDDGVTQFYLVSTDICLVSPTEYDEMATILQKSLGIDPANFWWTATHTHSAPEVGVPGLAESFMGERYKHEVDTAYTNFIHQTILQGVSEARKKMAPAKFGIGWGFSQANINRRAIDVDGRASIGLNPDAPVDRRIGVIRLERSNGTPLALIANYPIHGTVLGGQVKISGDVLGTVSEYVEEKTGVPVLFINGAAGNLAPIYSVYPTPEAGHLDQFKVLLGNKILDANNRIVATTDTMKLVTREIIVESPSKDKLVWPSYLKQYTRQMKNDLTVVKLPIRFLKINEDVAIWAAPLELFCEISNEIRENSPFPFTFYYGYTNGWMGYLPSRDEWKHGGYEVDVVSAFTPEMSDKIIEAVGGYLEGELRSATAKKPSKKQRK